MKLRVSVAEMKLILTGYIKVRGQLRDGFNLGFVWVVLGVNKRRNWIIPWLRMYPHLQIELR